MSERRRILLLDHDRHALAAATALLQDAGFEVVISGRQHGRVGFIARMRPDLVLLGVELPDMTGDEVLRAIAAHAVAAPVLILSTSEPAQLEDLVRQSRAAGHVHKSRLRGDLVARVAECLARTWGPFQLSNAR